MKKGIKDTLSKWLGVAASVLLLYIIAWNIFHIILAPFIWAFNLIF